jgi:hypothetical protein
MSCCNNNSDGVTELNATSETIVSSSCGCSTCSTSSTSCGCATSCAPVTPCAIPYYNTMCAENHSQTILKNQYPEGIKVCNSFNMPACGASATLTARDVTNVIIGSYLWNPNVGYLLITAFDYTTKNITVENTCIDGNIAVGSTVPANTYFLGTDYQVSISSSVTGNFLAVDFTAPAIGDCVPITVTAVAGISVGNFIQISSGIYRVSAVSSATTLQICNDGQGAIAGTPVIALNGSGAYQYPLALVNSDACANTPATQGALLICNGGIQTTLDASIVGAVPVVVDATTNAVEYKLLNISALTCTVLTADLTYAPAQPNYVVTVQDTTGFLAGDTLVLGTRPETLTIISVDDATHLTVSVFPIPVAIENITEGIGLCIDNQCDCNAIEARLTAIETDYLTTVNIVSTPLGAATIVDSQQIQDNPVGPAGIVDAGTPVFTGTNLIVNIANPSPTRTMRYIAEQMVRVYGDYDLGVGQLSFGINLLDTRSRFFGETVDNPGFAARPFDIDVTNTVIGTLAPGANVNVSVQAVVNHLSGAIRFRVDATVASLKYFAAYV